MRHLYYHAGVLTRTLCFVVCVSEPRSSPKHLIPKVIDKIAQGDGGSDAAGLWDAVERLAGLLEFGCVDPEQADDGTLDLEGVTVDDPGLIQEDVRRQVEHITISAAP